MTKKFTVTVDVTMSGEIEIEAESKSQAKDLAKIKNFNPSDLRTFHHIKTKVVYVYD